MDMTFDAWLAGGERIPLAGHRVFVRQDGPITGAPVTLIHGFPTSSHDWAPVIPHLCDAGLRVTTMDLLGFGASDKPRHHDYSILEQADLVDAAWTHLGIDATALVTHDYGVSVAQELLARDPSRIVRTAWLNGGVYPDLHRPIPVQRLLHSPVGKVLTKFTTERTFRHAMRQILGRPVADTVLHEMWVATSSAGGAAIQHRLLRYIDERATHAQRWTTALETYPGPTLFIWGPADPVSGAHVLPRLRQRLPRARVAVLDDEPATGHYPHLENPQAVAALLATFLSGGPPGAGGGQA
jgi:pimeloyl-ACP methyl ester carboxylesterase